MLNNQPSTSASTSQSPDDKKNPFEELVLKKLKNHVLSRELFHLVEKKFDEIAKIKPNEVAQNSDQMEKFKRIKMKLIDRFEQICEENNIIREGGSVGLFIRKLNIIDKLKGYSEKDSELSLFIEILIAKIRPLKTAEQKEEKVFYDFFTSNRDELKKCCNLSLFYHTVVPYHRGCNPDNYPTGNKRRYDLLAHLLEIFFSEAQREILMKALTTKLFNTSKTRGLQQTVEQEDPSLSQSSTSGYQLSTDSAGFHQHTKKRLKIAEHSPITINQSSNSNELAKSQSEDYIIMTLPHTVNERKKLRIAKPISSNGAKLAKFASEFHTKVNSLKKQKLDELKKELAESQKEFGKIASSLTEKNLAEFKKELADLESTFNINVNSLKKQKSDELKKELLEKLDTLGSAHNIIECLSPSNPQPPSSREEYLRGSKRLRSSPFFNQPSTSDYDEDILELRATTPSNPQDIYPFKGGCTNQQEGLQLLKDNTQHVNPSSELSASELSAVLPGPVTDPHYHQNI